MGGGKLEEPQERDDGLGGKIVKWREKRWDEKVPEALKHTPQWALVQDYFLLESAMQRRKEEKEGMSKDKPLPKAWNIPPSEEMIPSRLLGDDYQMYDNTPQAAPYDPMAASKRALMMEALRRIGALPEGTTPSF